MMGEAIIIKNVVKIENDRRVINNISLSVQKGECVSVCGPPGSGKSMLLRLITGLDKPSSGEISVLDQPVHNMRPDTATVFRNLHIGVLTRTPAFLSGLSLMENVEIPLLLRGEALSTRRKKVREQLKALGLLYASQANPSQLTRLEQYRTAVAQALVSQPDILILDDFAAELEQTDEITGILLAICQYSNMTILELTGRAEGLICADRTFRLEHGKIQEDSL